LVHNILTDSSLTDARKMALLRSEIPKLPEEPDPADVEQIRLKYPDLSGRVAADQGLHKPVGTSAKADHPRPTEGV
jgi:hypothetical protein